MENAKEGRGIEMVIAREVGCMKVKNEVQEKGRERDGWVVQSPMRAHLFQCQPSR